MKFLFNNLGQVSSKMVMLAGAGTVVAAGLAVGYLATSGDDTSSYIRSNTSQTREIMGNSSGGGNSAYGYGERALDGNTGSLSAAMTSGSRSNYTGVYTGTAPAMGDIGGGVSPDAIVGRSGAGLEGMGVGADASAQGDMFSGLNDAMAKAREMQAGAADSMALLNSKDALSKLGNPGGVNGRGTGAGGSASGSNARYNPNAVTDSSSRTVNVKNPQAGKNKSLGKSDKGRGLSGFNNATTNDKSKAADRRKVGKGSFAEAAAIQKTLADGGDNAMFIGEAYQNAGRNKGGVEVAGNTAGNQASDTDLKNVAGSLGHKTGKDNSLTNEAIELTQARENLRAAREKTIWGLIAIFSAASIGLSFAIAAAAKVPIFGHITALGLAVGGSAAGAILMAKILINHSDGVNLSSGFKGSALAITGAIIGGIWASFALPAVTAFLGKASTYVMGALGMGAAGLSLSKLLDGSVGHVFKGGAGKEKSAYDAAKKAYDAAQKK